MIEISTSSHAGVTRLDRRTALRVGGLAIGGLSLPDFLRFQSARVVAATKSAATAGKRSAPATAVIQVFLGGGPSHLDMYDLKCEAPAEIRGEFSSIDTAVPGIRVSEHLPLQAAAMDKLAIVRSVAHTTSSHLPASQWMLTGYHIPNVTSDNVHPSTGSVTAKLRGPNAQGLPAYVAIPRKTTYGNAAYLGPAFKPFTTEGDPVFKDFAVHNLSLPQQVTTRRLDDRKSLLAGLDNIRRDLDTRGEIAGLDRFYHEAIAMITSDRATRAFNISEEDPEIRVRYGHTSAGQGCLLARRLVEAGVTFVSVLSGGVWDTHEKNFSTLKNNSLPKVDRAISALVTDLHDRGLYKNVLVLAMGEFGRTPKINEKAGRDHWPGAMSVLFGGGGLKTGQVIGATDDEGAHPITHPYSPGDVLSTMYRVLGIDFRHEFRDHTGRPFPVLPEGTPIRELIG